MQTPPEIIHQLRNGIAQHDGQAIAFEIETQSGQVYPLACGANDIEKIVSWLIGLGQLADQQRETDGGGPDPARDSITAAPLAVKNIASGPGENPGEVLLGFDLGVFGLAFRLTDAQTRKLHGILSGAIVGSVRL